jgi:ABC-type transporter Mla subunit MlaD
VYEALEAQAKAVTGRTDKDLSANRGLFIKAVQASEPYKELLKNYVEYANQVARPRAVPRDDPSGGPVMNKHATVIFLALVLSGCGVVADAAEVKVISANGM